MIFLVEGIHRTMAAPRKYPDELRERAVRLVQESGRPIAHVADDLGVHREALRGWVRQAEADRGQRSDLLSSAEREELKRLRAELGELRRANEILKACGGQKSGSGKIFDFRGGVTLRYRGAIVIGVRRVSGDCVSPGSCPQARGRAVGKIMARDRRPADTSQ